MRPRLPSDDIEEMGTTSRDGAFSRSRKAEVGSSQQGGQAELPHFQAEENEEWLSSAPGNEYDEGEEATGGRTSVAGQRKRPWPGHQREGARGDVDMWRTPSRKLRAAEGCQREKPRAEMADGATVAGRPDPSMPLAVSSNEDGDQADDSTYYANWNRDPRGREAEHIGDEQGRADDSAENGDRGRREGAESSAGSGARRAGARRGCSGAVGGAARGGAQPRERGRGA